MNKEISRKPLIGIVGCENRQNANIGGLTGRIAGRREAILVFTFGSYPTYGDSTIPMDAALGAREAGGETLGITTNSEFSVLDDWRKRYATWILISNAQAKIDAYQPLVALCDAIISIGLDLPDQRTLIRRVAGNVPLIEIANTRGWWDKRPSLVQLAESPRAAIDSAIARIMGRRKGE